MTPLANYSISCAKRPTRSRVTATVTGVAGTNLPAASRARTSDGDVFRTVADVALAPSPGVSVDMEAVDEGSVMAAAGTLTQIVTVVAGWETITNAAAAVLGIPRQDDPQYRRAYHKPDCAPRNRVACRHQKCH